MTREYGVSAAEGATASVLLTLVNTLVGFAVAIVAGASLLKLPPIAVVVVAVIAAAVLASPSALPQLGAFAGRLFRREIVLRPLEHRVLLTAGVLTAIAWLMYGRRVLALHARRAGQRAWRAPELRSSFRGLVPAGVHRDIFAGGRRCSRGRDGSGIAESRVRDGTRIVCWWSRRGSGSPRSKSFLRSFFWPSSGAAGCPLMKKNTAPRAEPVADIGAPRHAGLWSALVYALATLWLGAPALAGKFLINIHSDQYLAGYAFREFGAQALRTTHAFPLWNPYILRRAAVRRGDARRHFLPDLPAAHDHADRRRDDRRLHAARVPRGRVHVLLPPRMGARVLSRADRRSRVHDGRTDRERTSRRGTTESSSSARSRRSRSGCSFAAFATDARGRSACSRSPSGLGVLSPHPQLLQYMLLVSGRLRALPRILRERCATTRSSERRRSRGSATPRRRSRWACSWAPCSISR